jgi:hypothetical protein
MGGAIVLGALTLAGLLGGRVALPLLACGVCVATAGELFRIGRAHGAHPAPLAGFAGILALLVVAHVRGEDAPPLFPAVLSATLVATFVAMLARRSRTSVAHGLAHTLLVVLVVGLLGSYVVVLRATPGGFRLALALVGMAAAAHATHARVRRASRAHGTRATVLALVAALAAGGLAAVAWPQPFPAGRALALALVVGAATVAAAGLADLMELDGANEPGVRRAPARLLGRVNGVLVSAPLFFYGFRVLAR